ncbi:MAG: hypothetical protein ACJ8F1_03795 [Polyangia bacterium]
MMTHADLTRLIDRHFAAKISVDEETEMRRHLPACATCAERYRRHLLLARFDRGAPGAARRLARGLGLPTPRARWAWPTRGLITATAVVGLVLIARPRVAVAPHSEAFAPRGASRAASSLWVYRLVAGGPPELVQRHIAPDDELAFAYANPEGRRNVAVFGVDEHRHVFWYAPGWAVGAPAPAAVSAVPGVGPHELAEAVRHAYDGHHLEVYAVFSDAPLNVEALDRAAAAPDGLDALRAAGASIVARSLEVGP